MDEKIFRKKSLDKIKSPDKLDDYIQVSNPGVWILMVSIIVLLIGACIWGMYGHVDSTVSTTVCARNGVMTCTVMDSDLSSIEKGMTVRFEDTEAVIYSIGEKTEDGYVCTLSSDKPLTDGIYKGEVVIKRHKPFSFIFN